MNFVTHLPKNDPQVLFNMGNYIFVNKLKIANRKRLENIKGDVELQVKNINYKATEDDFEDFLHKEKIEFIDFEFEYLDDGRSKGIAYVTLNKANAEKLIDLDNKVNFAECFSLINS